MDIFIYGVPASASTVQVGNFLQPLLDQLRITAFEHAKPKNKGFAFLYIKDDSQAKAFLDKYSRRSVVFPGGRYNKPVKFERSKQQDGGSKVRTMILQDDLNAHIFRPRFVPGYEEIQNHNVAEEEPNGVFAFHSLSCGLWTYHDSNPVFMPYYTNSRRGKLHIGRHALAVVLFNDMEDAGWSSMIDFPYHWLDSVVISNGKEPSLIITGTMAPKFIERIDPLLVALASMLTKDQAAKFNKKRTSGLDEAHKTISGRCFVYRLRLNDRDTLGRLYRFLGRNSAGPSIIEWSVTTLPPARSFAAELKDLDDLLSDYGMACVLPFAIRFQLLKFAYNGKLRPEKVGELWPILVQLIQVYSRAQCVAALRRLYTDLPYPQPHVPASEFLIKKVEDDLFQYASRHRDEGNFLAEHKHLKPVYHIQVTPAGIYLKGPEPEVTNRVIRKHVDSLESFARVTFCDEDGERVEFQRDTRLDEIYHGRFRAILNHCIPIGSKDFAFLGFSSSSMKNHTAWFMAPIVDKQTDDVLVASQVIEALGDFAHIRVPAKCAARIGQTFTDTTAWIEVQAKATAWAKDIEHPETKRVFSDGCGTISRNLLEQVWDQYPKLLMRLKPTVLQIRQGGSKGLVSLDRRLGDDMVVLRKSMWKFDARGSNHIEVCGMNDRPLPLHLNRPLIKILEDLGVPEESFIQLQDEMVHDLEEATSTAKRAAKFLDNEQFTEASGLAGLIRRMDLIGLDALRDPFLSKAVDAAAVLRTRDVKYRGRIKVAQGIKLYGIMDETGYLKENEIYCVTETPRDGRKVLCDSTGQGKPVPVAITRSPTMHPGDVQVVYAVDVPPDSILTDLKNVVVFSQHGRRDLASQLAGGDLDGDQFDIIYDPRLLPKKTYEAAEYPRTQAVELGRAVQLQDMSNFFVEFMENDKLGLISSYHLQLSDRLDEGSLNPACIELARLASVAVDYAKSGIKVTQYEIPRFDRKLKPDFMAPNPRVHIEAESIEIVEQKRPEPDAYTSLLGNEGGVQFYESQKVLGKLFRRIDERKFFRKREHRSKTMDQLWAYVTRAALKVQWWDYTREARQIRDAYEDNVQDTALFYAHRQTQPMLELEVVMGAMFGAANRRGRQDAQDMKSRFDRDVAYTRRCIRTDDEGNVGGAEALPRAMACFALAVKEPGRKMGREGPLVSFKYVAAALCLEELERFHGRLQPY